MNKEEWIPVGAPSITEREGELAREAAMNAWGADHYAYNKRFETMFADYIGVGHAVSLPHATSALHLALAAGGIGEGDEVIVPDVTWIASTAPISYVGATPVFVDILADTWCIDPEAVAKSITPRTKAIIGVDLYGSMCDWTRLQKIADENELFLIEDAAEALGSQYCGEKAGSFGNCAAFSFHGSKTVVTGEGGMFVTNDSDLHTRVQMLRDHGRPPRDRFFRNEEIAFKYKMSAVQAALGIAQMERIEELIDQKHQIFEWYKDALSGLNGVSLNAQPENTLNSYWMVTAILDPAFGLNKYELQERLKEKNIDTRPFFSRLSLLPAYQGRDECMTNLNATTNGDGPSTYGINLPSGYSMTQEKVVRVAAALREILQV